MREEYRIQNRIDGADQFGMDFTALLEANVDVVELFGFCQEDEGTRLLQQGNMMMDDFRRNFDKFEEIPVYLLN